ncbi:hypothetical protein ACEN8I_22625 [Polaromonas sp. CT11-55]|uniref:hypothetical protein n=1 Tax=Polaromonas sp. CT11-55 TaxID=3243045 RepID=UPI0039A7237C
MSTANETSQMGFIQRNRRRLVLVSALLMIAAIAVWRYYESRYPSWYEEVRLSDGRIIVVHQRREYYDNYGTKQSWVAIDLPELGGETVWHSLLMPQRVDVVDGKVYVFGIPRGARQLEHYRFPKHYMVAFRWSGTAFERVPFLQIPYVARKEENLFSCVPSGRPTKISIREKDLTWCPPRGDKGELGKVLDLSAYESVADQWAALYNWTNRSE